MGASGGSVRESFEADANEISKGFTMENEGAIYLACSGGPRPKFKLNVHRVIDVRLMSAWVAFVCED